MGGCRVAGPTCQERGTGMAGARRHANRSVADARPVGSGSSSSGPTLVGWPRQIAWSEFQEISRRPPDAKEDAQIKTELTQPDQVSVARDSGQFRLDSYEAKLAVNQDQSWVLKSAKTATLLEHEQGHYDITGLVARDLVADLRRARASSPKRLEREIQALIQQAQTLGDRLTKLYDTETGNSQTRDKQLKWEKHLSSCMQKGTRLTGGPP